MADAYTCRRAVAKVSIFLDRGDEHTPVLSNLPNSIAITEVFKVGSKIFTFTTLTTSEDLNYDLEIVDGNVNDQFAISDRTLFINKPLDAELQQDYRLEIAVVNKQGLPTANGK